MLSKNTFLAALLFTVTVSSDDPSPTDDRYEKVSEKMYLMCDEIQAMVDAGGSACYGDFLDMECACVGEAVRNLTGSDEKDNGKLIAAKLSTSCSNSRQSNIDMIVKVLKTEYAICKITPEEKFVAIEAAVKHCSKKCPNKEGNINKP